MNREPPIWPTWDPTCPHCKVRPKRYDQHHCGAEACRRANRWSLAGACVVVGLLLCTWAVGVVGLGSCVFQVLER